MRSWWRGRRQRDLTACAADATARRGLLRRGVLAGLAALGLGAGHRAAAAASPPHDEGGLTTDGPALRANVYRGRPPIEPLDTMIRFERSDESNGRAMTHEVLSLMHEEKGKRSFPWTLYAHLTTHHVEGDACVVCSRLHKKDRGWSCGLHSEVFNSAPAVALGMNIETTNEYAGADSQVIGLNVQAHGPHDCLAGIQIHDADGHFKTGLALNGEGPCGVDLGGRFAVGLNARSNSIRLNEGTRIELDQSGRVAIRYREGRIEFLNGVKVVAHINMEGQDHEL